MINPVGSFPMIPPIAQVEPQAPQPEPLPQLATVTSVVDRVTLTCNTKAGLSAEAE